VKDLVRQNGNLIIDTLRGTQPVKAGECVCDMLMSVSSYRRAVHTRSTLIGVGVVLGRQECQTTHCCRSPVRNEPRRPRAIEPWPVAANDGSGATDEVQQSTATPFVERVGASPNQSHKTGRGYEQMTLGSMEHRRSLVRQSVVMQAPTSGAPQDLGFIRIQLEPVQTHPAGDVADALRNFL
jgi:hypothetical protein